MPHLPRFTPMPLARRRDAFQDSDYLYEVKYDGFRALAYVLRDAATKLHYHLIGDKLVTNGPSDQLQQQVLSAVSPVN